MIDRYTNLGDVMAENPVAANILISYGIPSYGITENPFSTLEDISMKYGVDINSVINQINSGMSNLY